MNSQCQPEKGKQACVSKMRRFQDSLIIWDPLDPSEFPVQGNPGPLEKQNPGPPMSAPDDRSRYDR